MQRDARAYLWDVKGAIDKIHAFVGSQTRDAFVANDLMQSGVERQLEIIGEALSQLSRTSPDLAGQVPDLAKIVGLRNVLIHGYAVVDPALIWQTVQENLPDLRATMDRLLASNG